MWENSLREPLQLNTQHIISTKWRERISQDERPCEVRVWHLFVTSWQWHLFPVWTLKVSNSNQRIKAILDSNKYVWAAHLAEMAWIIKGRSFVRQNGEILSKQPADFTIFWLKYTCSIDNTCFAHALCLDAQIKWCRLSAICRATTLWPVVVVRCLRLVLLWECSINIITF